MSSVDDRIVNMQFNSRQFTQGATESQQSLKNLEGALQNTAKSKGLEQLGQSVDGLKHKFSIMQIAGVSAIATLASKATMAGIGLIKSLTIDPILQGWQEYNLNLQSTQTIMANTGKSVHIVTDALDKLNAYSDQTIYNFAQMAKNVGTFSAAGVKLKTSVSAIKGISNMAALSGSTAEQASMAMYQLSQAIAAGRVNLQDWNSVVNAGMGGKNLQRALIQTGVAMGTVSGKAVQLGDKIKIAGQSFRESISAKPGQAAWLTSDVLVKTLSIMDGRLSKTAITANIMAKGNHTLAEAEALANQKLKEHQATLAKQGFNEEQIKNLTTMASRAYDSATVVKTLPQLLGVVRESIGSVWSTAFRGIVGNFKQSKELWTSASNSISKITKSLNYGLTDMIVGWKRAGGRIAFIDALRTGFIAIGKILSTVKIAFRDVFPPGAGEGLANFSKTLQSLAYALTPSAKTLDNLRSIFGGMFAVLHIGITIVKAVAAGFGALFGGLFKGSGEARGGILEFLASIGEMLKDLDKFLTSGGKMVDIFHQIGVAAGKMAGEGLSIVTGIIGGIVNGIENSDDGIKNALTSLAGKIVDFIKNALGIHSPAAKLVPVGIAIVQGIAEGILKAIPIIFTFIGKLIAAIVTGFGKMFGSMSALDFGALMNTILTSVLLLTLNNITFQLKNFSAVFLGVFSQFGSTLKNFENMIKAKALMAIAIAVGLLTASVIALSFVDVKKAGAGIAAIGILMGILVMSFRLLSGMGDSDKGLLAGTARITAMAAAIDAMATAVAILTASVAALSLIPLGKLAKGVTAVAVIMGILVGSIFLLSKIGYEAEGAAATMLTMAVAIDLLTGAILAMALVPFEKLAKGVIIIAAMMTVITTMIGILGTVGGKILLRTSIALIAMAVAIDLMAAALVALSVISWGSILKGLAKLTVIILALSALSFLAEALGALGLALLALGAAFALAGAGMFLFATGFALMAATGVAGIAVMTAVIGAFIAMLPSIAAQMAAAFVTFIEVIAEATPRLRTAFGKIFQGFIGMLSDNIPVIIDLIVLLVEGILDAIVKIIPKWGNVIETLIATAIRILKNSAKRWGEAALTMIQNLLESIAKHLPDIIKAGTDILVALIEGFGKSSARIADAIGQAILSFIQGIDAAIVKYEPQILEAGGKIAFDLINGLTGGLLGRGVELVKQAAETIANSLPGWMKKVLGIKSPSKVTHEIGRNVARGLANGISEGIAEAVAAAVRMANSVLAVGSAAVASAQQMASDAQRKADAAQAAADASTAAAQKVKKSNPKLSKKLSKQAEKQQQAADAAQAQADAAAQSVSDAKDFAEADLHGKGDIQNAQATDLAGQASRMLAKANAEAAEAKKLMKSNKKAGRAMLAQAQKDAQEAARLAAAAQAANAAANQYYAEEVKTRIAQIEADRKAEADAKKAQAEYDAADTQGKIDILNKQAEAAQAKADAANAAAVALINQAKAIADSDAAGAMKLLDQAEEQAQLAKDAADAAQQAKDQISQLTGQSDSGGGSSTPIQPSRSILEDAASSVDRYTASLQAAEQAAAATQSVIQYVQNNYSPEALSASEVYRQTNNLLSAVEIKMGVSGP